MSEDSLIARLNMIDAEIRHEDDLIGQRISWLALFIATARPPSP